jgi:hypothetical protein
VTPEGSKAKLKFMAGLAPETVVDVMVRVIIIIIIIIIIVIIIPSLPWSWSSPLG